MRRGAIVCGLARCAARFDVVDARAHGWRTLQLVAARERLLDEMTTAMVRALEPGGRLVFVEYRMEDPNVLIELVHRMTEKQVRKEMGLHPLEWVETLKILPRPHIVIFKK